MIAITVRAHFDGGLVRRNDTKARYFALFFLQRRIVPGLGVCLYIECEK